MTEFWTPTPDWTFDTIPVGSTIDIYEHILTRGRALHYLEAIEEADNPFYNEASPYGKPVTASTVCDNDVINFHGKDVFWAPMIPAGVFHAYETFDYIGPVFPGQKMTVEVKLAQKFIRRNKYYVGIQGTSSDENNKPVFRSLCVMCYGGADGKEDTPNITDVLVEASEVEGKSLAEGEGITVNGKTLKVGDELPGYTKTVDIVKAGLYSWWPKYRSIHNDEREAKKFGLPTVLMEGMQATAQLSQLATNVLGKYWIEGGKLAIKYIGSVFPPDVLTVKGTVKAIAVKDKTAKVVLDVWVENQKDQKIQVAIARSGEIPV